MKRILVMGAGGVAGINFIQCLRLSGEKFYIVGCDINKWHLELTDVDKKYLVPYSIEPDYIETINTIIDREGIDFIHAQPDMEVEVLSENREDIHSNHLLPRRETILNCRDKMATNALLSKKGINVPLSIQVKSINNLKQDMEYIMNESDRDVIWLRAIKGAGSKAALPVKSYRQAREWIHYWRSTKMLESRDFMISELLPGREYAFQSLWYKGELITSQARERIEYLFGNLFPSGQSSSPSVARTVHNEDVNRVATEAVNAIDEEATGIFCIDLKENSKGIPCVTEINVGRFFTTSNFFAQLGSNMPYYYIKMGLEHIIFDLPKYDAVPEGFYWIRLVDGPPVIVKEGEWGSIRFDTQIEESCIYI
jgi:hypothetical protein